WANKFKVEMTESDNPPTSWFLNFLGHSQLAMGLRQRLIQAAQDRIDKRLGGALKAGTEVDQEDEAHPVNWVRRIVLGIILLIVAYGLVQLVGLLITVPLSDYGRIAVGTLATTLRVLISLVIGVLWTVPLGVAI